MLKHIVMWKLKAEAGTQSKMQNAAQLKTMLEALVGKIPELKSLEVGINAIASDASYDAVLITTFDNETDLKTYDKHPEHLKVRAFCKTIAQSRIAVDYFL